MSRDGNSKPFLQMVRASDMIPMQVREPDLPDLSLLENAVEQQPALLHMATRDRSRPPRLRRRRSNSCASPAAASVSAAEPARCRDASRFPESARRAAHGLAFILVSMSIQPLSQASQCVQDRGSHQDLAFHPSGNRVAPDGSTLQDRVRRLQRAVPRPADTWPERSTYRIAAAQTPALTIGQRRSSVADRRELRFLPTTRGRRRSSRLRPGRVVHPEMRESHLENSSEARAAPRTPPGAGVSRTRITAAADRGLAMKTQYILPETQEAPMIFRRLALIFLLLP